MQFLLPLLFSVGLSQYSIVYPPTSTLVSDGDVFTLNTACSSTMVAVSNATQDNYWYCDSNSLGEASTFKAGLNGNTYGALAISVPVNQEMTIGFNFASNVDDSTWGDDPDFAVLAQVIIPFSFPFAQDEAGVVHLTMCVQTPCNENTDNIDSAIWDASNWALSTDTRDGDAGVSSMCKPDKTATYYVNFKNKGEDGVAEWYFYPVVDAEGQCYYDAEVSKIVALILTIIGVTCGICCCCACCIFCLCFGGMAMIMGNAASKDTQTIQTTTVSH